MTTDETTTDIVKMWPVWHSVHTGQGKYDAFFDDGRLLPVEVRDSLAPQTAVAKVELNLPKLRVDAWDWKGCVAFDDRIAITSGESATADREVLFIGFVVDVDHSHSRREESVIITAASNAFRLKRDIVVAGRYMLNQKTGEEDTKVAHYRGLPCHFNAGGKPNRHPVLQEDLAEFGAPDRGVAVFTFDGDPNAVWWSKLDVHDYLMWTYNERQTWLSNDTFTAAAYAAAEGGPSVMTHVEVAVEGMDLWSALAAVGERAGDDVYEQFSFGESTGLTSTIQIVAKHTGALRTVKHQPVNVDGTPQKLNPALTNLFSSAISESTTSCITRPTIVGGPPLREITIELGKAWDPDLIDLEEEDAILSTAAGGKPDSTETYCKQYIIGGADFAKYCGVGRLWDANTDDKYSSAPYSLTVTDVAPLAGDEALSWPKMPHKPLPCLTRLAKHSFAASVDSYLELTVDGGTNWYGLTGYKVLPDRLGVYLTTANLADIVLGGGDNFFVRLTDDGANVKLRLTCTVAGPHRSSVVPDARITAGTHFAQTAFFDLGSLGTEKKRSESSRFYGLGAAGPAADETGTDYLAYLTAAAAKIQDIAEDRLIEASLPIEWPDPSIWLTDQVERIEGIEYDLQTNAGAGKLAPRVVQRTFLLRAETYCTQITLDTDRKAGLI